MGSIILFFISVKGKKLTTLDNLLPCELFICFKCNPFTARVLDGVLYVTLTFESVDKILYCDHSIKSSLPVLLHEAICFSKFLQNEIWTFGRNLPLAIFGSERVKQYYLWKF